MRKIINAAVKERKVTILIFVILMVMGCYNYFAIPKQEFPEASFPAGIITTIYPGANPEDVEELVSKKIEDKMNTVEGIKTIRTISMNSVSTVVLEFEYLDDQERTFTDVREKLDQMSGELPESATEPYFDNELFDTAGIIVAFSGESYSYGQLAEFAEVYKEALVKVDGVRKVDINGDIARRVEVTVDHNKLNQYSLSIKDVYDILQSQNVQIPPGSLDTELGKINVNTTGRFESVRDIENMILLVSSENGSILRLKDVATVAVEDEGGVQKYRNNGKDAVLLSVYFKPDKNIIAIGKDVRKVINGINSDLPENLAVEEVLYQPQVVDDSLSDFIASLVQGVIFVIIVVFLGMGMRNAVIVSTAIPITIFITFNVMTLMNMDLQQMSTSALIIALGILVDNAIVISDAIQVKINEGLSNFEAAVEGAKESSIPVLTSTLTTVAAFTPLLFLSGFAGEFAFTLPMVVIIALVISYIIAMVFTPAVASKFFKVNNDQKLNKIKRLRIFFSDLLEKSLKNKKTVIFAVVVALSVTGILVMFMDIQLFPYADKDQLYLEIENELLGDLDSTDELIVEVEKLLASEAAISSYTSAIGGPLPKFYMITPFNYPSSDFGQVLIYLDLSESKGFDDKVDYAYYLQDQLDQTIIGGKVKVNILEMSEPKPEIEIRIQGDDLDRLIEVGTEIKDALKEMDALVNVEETIPNLRYEYLVDVDKELSSAMGISQYDIERQINLAVNGANATVMRKEGKELAVYLKSDIASKDELENLMIKSSFVNNKYLVKQLADIELVSKRDIVSRFQKEAIIQINANVRPEYTTSEVQSEISAFIMDEIDKSGVDVSFGGEKEFFAEYMGSLGLAGIIAIALIYLILLIQFNSFIQPLVILITAPLSVVGSILGLFIFRMPITFTSLLGVISLFGIVVNNGILLIEYINKARSEGSDIESACKDSVSKRFNPIILSTATTIMGLVPLALSGSSFFAPMAVALMSGLVVATVLTMVIIPTVYRMIVR